MKSVLDVLATSGAVLLGSPPGGRKRGHEYYRVVAKIYMLLNRIHDEVLDYLTQARLSTTREDADNILRTMLNPDLLTSGLRARDLCDELERQGRALLATGNVRPGSDANDLVHSLVMRERGTAEFYVNELEPIILNVLAQQSDSDLKAALREFRDKLVRQQAGFIDQAEQAILQATE
jgi:hypothetical protein